MLREAGMLLHITSLGSKYGVGTLGRRAYEFVDFLESAKLTLWQILPLYLTGYGDSPYQANSSKSLNYYLIDFEELIADGLVTSDFVEAFNYGDNKRVNYNLLFQNKLKVLKEAYFNYVDNGDFERFVQSKEYHEFALFMTVKNLFNFRPWYEWPAKYKNYSKELDEYIVKNNLADYRFYLFTQFIFLKQWNKLKNYANQKGISIIGDMPLYLAYDSSDCWMHKELFQLNAKGEMTRVAGCPPDDFSKDGQLWGNPLYNWDGMKEDNYSWWTKRINDALTMYDYLRIDHFRGLDRYYSISNKTLDATKGHWVSGPKMDLLKNIKGDRIIAEDLGTIDRGVLKLLKDSNYPGMRVLEFAFDKNLKNVHKPSNYIENSICYTGTHDNMTLKGYIHSLNKTDVKVFIEMLTKELSAQGIEPNFTTEDEAANQIVELAFASKAKFTIIPVQDFLLEGNESRMNFPSTLSNDNWSYIVDFNKLDKNLAQRIKELVLKYHRD